MKHRFGIFLIFVTFGSLLATPSSLIPNLQNPAPFIFTSGQPTEEGFAEAARRMGIQTIVNVLPEKYCVESEAKVVQENGMAYRSVPFSTTDFQKRTIEQFADVLKNAKKPVLIHCSTGNHAGGMWFAYRVLIQNKHLEESLIEARQIGLRPELEKRLFDWVLEEKGI